jgi:hypothetical protein
MSEEITGFEQEVPEKLNIRVTWPFQLEAYQSAEALIMLHELGERYPQGPPVKVLAEMQKKIIARWRRQGATNIPDDV